MLCQRRISPFRPLHTRPVAGAGDLRHMLSAERLSLKLGQKQVLDGVSVILEPGSVTGLGGPSGAGKTSLGRCLAGLMSPASGAVRLNSAALPPCAPSDRTLCNMCRRWQSLPSTHAGASAISCATAGSLILRFLPPSALIRPGRRAMRGSFGRGTDPCFAGAADPSFDPRADPRRGDSPA